MLPRYMSEAVSVAVFTMLAGAAIVAMLGIMALSIGVRWMFVRPTMRSWTALWPGMSLTLVSPLLMTWSGHAATVRVVLLFAAALAVLLAGSFLEWQAPVVMGGGRLCSRCMSWCRRGRG